MIRRNQPWTIDEVYRKRNKFQQAEYQRDPRLWKLVDKRRLIDSILRDIDIPKIYLYEFKKDEYEIIDGQQRLYAIWEFIENSYKFESETFPELKGKNFDDFALQYKNKIKQYELQFTILKKAEDEYLKELFLRLQLGLLLVAGEKLKAESGYMRDFVFNEMAKHPFIKEIKIPNKRHAKEALCAQICINSFRKSKEQPFSRTRYEDLHYFFRAYKELNGAEKRMFEKKCKHTIDILEVLWNAFGEKAKTLRNRSFILSIYLFVEELHERDQRNLNQVMPLLVSFTEKLLQRLKEEAKLGFDKTNEELYRLESYLSNAPGEKYQIENRHKHITKLFKHFQKTKEIKGDKTS